MRLIAFPGAGRYLSRRDAAQRAGAASLLEIAKALQPLFEILLTLRARLRRGLDVRLVEMLAESQERDITERDPGHVADVAVGEQDRGYLQGIDAVVGAPVIVIGLQQRGSRLAKTRFGGGAEAGGVAHHQVRAEAGVGAVERFVLEQHAADDLPPVIGL